MPDIHHSFPISARIDQVYDLFTKPEGLSAWWTLDARGEPMVGSNYQLDFGSGYV